jgi:hypothetical protein
MARLDVPTAFAGAISRDVFGDACGSQRSSAAGPALPAALRPRALLAIVHRTDPPAYFFIGDSADLHFDAAQLPEGWRTLQVGAFRRHQPGARAAGQAGGAGRAAQAKAYASATIRITAC